MIKNSDLLVKFEYSLISQTAVSVEDNFRIVNALYVQARNLKVFPLKDPLEGIEFDISFAKKLNSV